MKEPTVAQKNRLYHLCYWLTNLAFQPIHIIRLDERTGNVFVLAGCEETLEFEIKPDGGLHEQD
jgi:hypothetical protein